MGIEEDKANVVTLIEDFLGKGDFSTLERLAMPDFVDHNVPQGMPGGMAGAKMMVQNIRTGFPDFKVEVEDAVAEGDRVAVRITASGTHTGMLFNVPPTGKHAKWAEIHIARVKNGRMVEHWFVADIMSMMRQLGLMPSPPQH